MQPLLIHAQNTLPYVLFDTSKETLIIEGKSIPEDSSEFYHRIFDWLDIYKKTPNKKTILSLKLDYYNSSSARELANIIKIFDELYKQGFDVLVRWYYNQEDDVMKENGDDFKILFTVPIEIISFKI